MAERATRSPLLWLAVALALAGTWAVARGPRGGDGDLRGDRRGETTTDAGELLTGGPPAGPDGAGPSLAGIAREQRATHGPVEVRVLDLLERPLAGVVVTASWSTPPATEGGEDEVHWLHDFTDAQGIARFRDLPWTGAVLVAGRARAAYRESHAGGTLEERLLQDPSGVGSDLLGSCDLVLPLAQAWVQGPDVTLRVSTGLPLDVHIEDAASGRPVSGAPWSVTPRVGWDEDSPHAATLPDRRGSPVALALTVRPPPGMLAQEPGAWERLLHPAAERAEIRYPLRRTARVVVAFPREVQPFHPEEWSGNIWVAGHAAPREAQHFDGQGRLVVDALPWLSGERVDVQGQIADRWIVGGKALLGADARETVHVTLRAYPMPDLRHLVAQFESNGAHLTVVHVRLDGTKIQLTLQQRVEILEQALQLDLSGVALAEPPPSPRYVPRTLRVKVLTPTGLQAARAVVTAQGRSAVTDERGVATFEEFPAGESDLVVLGAGAGVATKVSVTEQGETEIEVRAERGGTLEVEVVDEQGRGLPYATLAVEQPHGLPWIDLFGGTQRLDPFTDVRGRRRLAGVLGDARVTGTYGSRSATAEVEVPEGSVQTVRLVLPSVALEPPEKAPDAGAAPEATGDAPPPR